MGNGRVKETAQKFMLHAKMLTKIHQMHIQKQTFGLVTLLYIYKVFAIFINELLWHARLYSGVGRRTTQ